MVGIQWFALELTMRQSFRLLKERHAEELFALMNQNRKYLREWLPWLETNKSLEDTKEFIRARLSNL